MSVTEPEAIPVDFEVESRPLSDDLVLIAVSGELDVATGPTLKKILYDLIAAGNYSIVLDFNKVRYIDSTGMGVLLGGVRRIREHDGHLLVICSNPRIQKLFTITGLARVFDIFASEEALLQKFHKRTMV